MRIVTGHSCAADPATALAELTVDIGTSAPQLIVVYLSVGYPAADMLAALKARFPETPIQGGTSCCGVMSDRGFHSDDGHGAGLFAIFDPDGAYGSAIVDIGDHAAAAAAAATERALELAGRPGELPGLVWMLAAPGNEEALLSGIEDVIGPNVPIVGGSTADNDVSGNWQQFCGDAVHSNAVTVSVLYPSTRVTTSFRSGYSPTELGGRVTRSDGRVIQEIDGQPAADVYARWTGLEMRGQGGVEASVLMTTTLYPLGRPVGLTGGVQNYRLSHPEAVTADGGLRLFTAVDEGDELTLMTGSRESLITRAGRAAAAAAGSAEMQVDDIAGALVIYCAGCMLTVGEDMSQVPGQISSTIGGAPFLGAFSFGEQGCMRDGENIHGNLMISAVLFGAT